MDEKEVIAEAEKLFAQADADGSGEIDYSEWAVATINKRSVLTEAKLRGAFELFDKVRLCLIILSGWKWNYFSR